jgi:MOSC domain-containing protein YiiM
MSIQQRLNGNTLGVYLGLDKISFVTTSQTRVTVTFAGFEGDRHAGITRKADSRTPQYPRGTEIRNDRQVSIVSVEELAQIATEMCLPEIKPEWLGANLSLQGIPNLTALPAMTRLFFGAGAVLVIQAENLPCQHPGKIIQDAYARPDLQGLFPKAGMHLRGLVACVEKPGAILQGDPVDVEIPQQTLYALR